MISGMHILESPHWVNIPTEMYVIFLITLFIPSALLGVGNNLLREIK